MGTGGEGWRGRCWANYMHMEKKKTSPLESPACDSLPHSVFLPHALCDTSPCPMVSLPLAIFFFFFFFFSIYMVNDIIGECE